ncbi:hypothetical protein, partial [Tetragenococcus halophilus]
QSRTDSWKYQLPDAPASGRSSKDVGIGLELPTHFFEELIHEASLSSFPLNVKYVFPFDIKRK